MGLSKSLVSFALQEIISTGTRMCDDSLVRAASRENNSISARASSRVRVVGVQDRKFVVGSCTGKFEAFIIVVLVGVFAAADSLAVLVVAVALLHGFVDV